MRATEVLQRYMEGDCPDFDKVVLTDVNQHGKFGNTPLNYACKRGNLEEVEALPAAGANVDAEGEMGDKPLHDTAIQGHLAVVKRLLAAGASPNMVNDYGRTPRDFAVSLNYPNVVAAIDDWCKLKGSR